jgi:hypothetical protein
MFSFFIISTSFLCSFVLAQEFNKPPKPEESLTNFVDILVSYLIPLLIYIIIDYEYDKETEDVDSRIGNVVYSFMFFVKIGLQEEIAFMIVTVEISYYIKLLQHIVCFVTGIAVIGQFIYALIKKLSFSNAYLRSFQNTFNLFYYIASILNIVVLCLLVYNLKERINNGFIFAVTITNSLIFIAIIVINNIMFEDSVLTMLNFDAFLESLGYFILVSTFYSSSLVSCFILQTPLIFNKVFLNLSALLVTSWIIYAYKEEKKKQEERKILAINNKQ